MQIMDEYQTIDFIRTNRTSIARYGDGELKLCLGKSAKSQHWNLSMQTRLREILLINGGSANDCLVGIPRIHAPEDKARMSERKWSFWKSYAVKKITALYNHDKHYGSAFITRPDAAPAIDCKDYYDKVKELWRDRDVLVMHGEGTGFLKQKCLIETAKTSRVLTGPIRDAYSHHKDLVRSLLKHSSNDTIILLSLGPEATVLAFDMAMKGRQTLDLGHMGMFYAHIHPKDKNWDGSKYDVY